MSNEDSQVAINVGKSQTIINKIDNNHINLNSNIKYNKLNVHAENKINAEENYKATLANFQKNSNNNNENIIKDNEIRKACTCFGYFIFKKG